MKTYTHSHYYNIYYSSNSGDIYHTMTDTYIATKRRVKQLRSEGFEVFQISRVIYEEIVL